MPPIPWYSSIIRCQGRADVPRCSLSHDPPKRVESASDPIRIALLTCAKRRRTRSMRWKIVHRRGDFQASRRAGGVHYDTQYSHAQVPEVKGWYGLKRVTSKGSFHGPQRHWQKGPVAEKSACLVRFQKVMVDKRETAIGRCCPYQHMHDDLDYALEWSLHDGDRRLATFNRRP
jgi:hypothetical protein